MPDRRSHRDRGAQILDRNPVVALLGARQVGKTTLARQMAEAAQGPGHLFDLEHPGDRAALADPMRTLEPLEALVVLGETRHLPEVFPVLRILADRATSARTGPTRVLVLESASEPVRHRHKVLTFPVI